MNAHVLLKYIDTKGAVCKDDIRRLVANAHILVLEDALEPGEGTRLDGFFPTMISSIKAWKCDQATKDRYVTEFLYHFFNEQEVKKILTVHRWPCAREVARDFRPSWMPPE